MSVVLSDVSFSFPGGRVLLDKLSASFNRGRTGLIGVNGAGKSTLLRIIAGQLRPASGAVTTRGEVGYLPQNLTLDADASVASLLGIAGVRDAIRAIEAGSVDPAAFNAVGDDWDAEDRAREWLGRLGLGHLGLDDPVRRLSGGETVLTALSALLLRRPAVLLLDEPTNSLDLDARRRPPAGPPPARWRASTRTPPGSPRTCSACPRSGRRPDRRARAASGHG